MEPYWRFFSEEDVEDLQRGIDVTKRPSENTIMSDNGQPSILEAAKALAAANGCSVAEADAWIRRRRRTAEDAPPRDPSAPIEVDPVRLARTIAHQTGVPYAEAQRIAVRTLDAGRRAQMKDAAAFENDAKARATTAALTPAQMAEHHAVVVLRSSAADTPPNVLASLVASRLAEQGFATHQAEQLAVVAVNEARGLPARPPAPAARLGARNAFDAERTKAREMVVTLSAKLPRAAKVAAIAMRLERESHCAHAAALELAAEAVDGARK